MATSSCDEPECGGPVRTSGRLRQSKPAACSLRAKKIIREGVVHSRVNSAVRVRRYRNKLCSMSLLRELTYFSRATRESAAKRARESEGISSESHTLVPTPFINERDDIPEMIVAAGEEKHQRRAGGSR